MHVATTGSGQPVKNDFPLKKTITTTIIMAKNSAHKACLFYWLPLWVPVAASLVKLIKRDK